MHALLNDIEQEGFGEGEEIISAAKERGSKTTKTYRNKEAMETNPAPKKYLNGRRESPIEKN